MQIPDLLVVQLLKNAGKLSDQQFEQLKSDLIKQKRPVQYLAIAEGLATEAELAELYAKDLGISFVEVSHEDITPEYLRLIPEASARRLHAVVVAQNNGRTQVATTDPANPAVVEFLHKLLGEEVDICLTSSRSLATVLAAYQHLPEDRLPKTVEPEGTQESADQAGVVARTLQAIIQKATALKASDVHIEPSEHVANTRFRIDGQLRPGPKLPLQAVRSLAEHCKSLAGLQPADSKTPQSGDFMAESSGKAVTISVNTLPVIDGEKITLHLQQQDASMPDLKELGLWGESLYTVQSAMAQTQGLMIVAGPDSTRRSQILFSLLNTQARPGKNVSTLQERVTHRLAGANQSQIKPEVGLTYAKGLRALLRQDSDVILVDNLPDIQSAQTATLAALDGRLVLAGLAMQEPMLTITRLTASGTEPFLLAQALQLIIGQRQVRSLCQHCRQNYVPDVETKEQLQRVFHVGTADTMQGIHRLEKTAVKAGLNKSDTLGSTRTEITQLWRASDKGCDECHGQGYSGTTGLFEVVKVSDSLRQCVSDGASLEQLTTQARANGSISWQLDGLVKALRGVVDVQDVLNA